MDKLNCIEDYFAATKAYYLFWRGKHCQEPEWEKFILNKKYLNGAKAAFLSNLMLWVYEDLVDNKGNLIYESKLYVKELEKSVKFISTKVSNGYKIGNYLFPDEATLVAIIRNKLAHGKYTIDFEHGRIILNHKGSDIVLSIYKLMPFMLNVFMNTIYDVRLSVYERNIVLFQNDFVTSRTEGIKDEEELRKIIKSYKCMNFKLESINGNIIPKVCREAYESFLVVFKKDHKNAFISDSYKTLDKLLKIYDCKLSYKYNKLTDKDDLEQIFLFAKNEVLGNPNLNYKQQLEMIGVEVHGRFNSNSNVFNSLSANVKNLVLLDAIDKTNSIDDGILSDYVFDKYGKEIKFNYDEFGLSLISMFNALFLYPMDDIYDISGGYTLNRSEGLDFASLDLSMVNPDILIIDDTPLLNAKNKLDSLVNKQVQVTRKILLQQENLGKVVGNVNAENAINKNINDLRITLSSMVFDYITFDGEYNKINDDFNNNKLYFRNKAIIEGIRNSIAHGHYEFITNGDFNDTIIVFNDIYEGKLTFQLKIKFVDFEKMINENSQIMLNFVNNKLKVSTSNVLVRK